MGEQTTDEPAEVGTVYNRNGERCVGWVLTKLNRRGRERWKGRVERQFVSWHIEWSSRWYRSREQAVAAVERVLNRIERERL